MPLRAAGVRVVEKSNAARGGGATGALSVAKRASGSREVTGAQSESRRRDGNLEGGDSRRTFCRRRLAACGQTYEVIRTRGLFSLIAMLVLPACGAAARCAAPARTVSLPNDDGARDAYASLRSVRGPTRFQQVGPQLYRGGQPTAAHLLALRALGVHTIINLRDTPGAVATERADAERLGLRFLNFPFSGLSNPDPKQLREINAALIDPTNGSVYVHCREGRDRTSLVVALYRVWHDGWPPEMAWHHEADDYGHGGWRHFFFRKLDRAFVALTHAS